MAVKLHRKYLILDITFKVTAIVLVVMFPIVQSPVPFAQYVFACSVCPEERSARRHPADSTLALLLRFIEYTVA